MKIAVYTITKNEEHHIQRWAASASEADLRLVVDTGSSDNTVEVAEAAGCAVRSIVIDPWRFDVARNWSLDLIPKDFDFCIALDADEVLLPGWRQCLESMDRNTTRPQYEYTWSWNEDGTPGLIYGGDKIHTRHGYVWKHPVHEVLMPIDPNGAVEQRTCIDLKIHHHPDTGKSRSYLPLLELSVSEDPTDDRNAHYLGREYLYTGQFDKAAAELKRHLSLPKAVWPPERAKSMRLLAKCETARAEHWLLRAAAEDPNRREPWYDLALLYHKQRSWPACYASAMRALTVQHRPMDYLSEAEPWSGYVEDLAAVSAHHLGLHQEAHDLGVLAVELSPTDERLIGNLAHYRKMISEPQNHVVS